MRPQNTAPSLRPEEFGLFAAALREDSEFPQTFGAWLERTAFGPLGCRSGAVEIAFDEFMAHCESLRLAPAVRVLKALAHSKTAGQPLRPVL